MQETQVQSPGSRRSSGEGNGNPLQYSGLENPLDWGDWLATVHGVSKSRTGLRDFTFTFFVKSENPNTHRLKLWQWSQDAIKCMNIWLPLMINFLTSYFGIVTDSQHIFEKIHNIYLNSTQKSIFHWISPKRLHLT